MAPSTEPDLEDRLQQQRVVADLGQRGLTSDDVDALMGAVCEAITETLGTARCGIFECARADEVARLRHAVGWEGPVDASVTTPTAPDSQVGFTLQSGDPVIVGDVRTENRFAIPAALNGQGIDSGISVRIGCVERPWGVLWVDTTDRDDVTEHDATFVQNVANVLASAIARTEREHSSTLFRRLLDRSTDAAFVEDPETGRILDANETAVKQLGYDREELLDLSVPDIEMEFPTEDAYTAFVDELRSGGRLTVDGVHRCKDGSTIPVEVNADYVELDRPYVFAIARDVTERRRRERALERAHERVEVALSVSDATVWEWNPDTDEMTTHPDPHGLFGERVETSEDFYEAICPDDRERVRKEATKAVESGSPYLVTFQYERDGERRWAEDYGQLFGGERGGDRRMIGIVRDVTEEKRRERALEEATRRYRSLVDNFPNGAVALFDRNLQFIATGGELLENRECEDPVGNTLGEQYPDDVVAAVEPHFRATLAGESREFEVDHYDGHFLGRTVPVGPADDAGSAGMVVLLDVTARRRYRKRLEESHGRLEEFATAVSHDLREPLGTVANYLQLLERRYQAELDEDAQEFIEYAVSGATRMREMIDGLVTTFARLEEGDDPTESVDLEAVVADVLVDLEGRIEETDATVTVDQLPTVAGERGQLRQLFLNLVDNAIKYAGDAPPRVHISAERSEAGWALSVRDEGIGMDEGATEEIFEVFHRLHPEEYPGSGIGLALCHRIVERHGGEIWVDSAPGAGATFSFTLPDRDDP